MIKGSDRNFKPSDKITHTQLALIIKHAYENRTGMKYTAPKAPYTDFGAYNKETVDGHLEALRT